MNLGCEMSNFVFFEFIINIIRDTRELLVIKAIFNSCETFGNHLKRVIKVLRNVGSIRVVDFIRKNPFRADPIVNTRFN